MGLDGADIACAIYLKQYPKFLLIIKKTKNTLQEHPRISIAVVWVRCCHRRSVSGLLSGKCPVRFPNAFIHTLICALHSGIKSNK